MTQNKKQLTKVYSNPKLKAPFLLAAGPGTANVGLTTAGYLREKLRADLMADIEPGDFFMPPFSFAFRDGLIDTTPIELGEKVPQNRFHYWKSGKAHDIIFFTGNAHPLPGKVPELAGYVLEIAKSFGLYRLYMPGAFLTEIHHLHEPIIYGSATSRELREYLHSYNIAHAPPMNIAHNLNAWFLGMAKSKNIDAVGLISEIPAYKPEDGNIRACRALVKLLIQMCDLGDLNISDLDTMLDEEDKLMEKRLVELRESNDQRAADFLEYLGNLERRSQIISDGRSILMPSEIELPAALKYIEGLYAKARSDSSRIPELRMAVQKLDASDRLLILRKYGDEIMSLLGYQV